MKPLLFWILKILSRLVLKKYNPKIIGITGSVGKTTTKTAIFHLLKDDFNVRASQDSFNNQLGLPITILGLENSKSPFVWIMNILKAKRLIFFKDKNYPKVLVLEMGADRLGDIAYLNTIAPADIAVLTEVAPVHTEWLGDLDSIFDEKSEIFKGKQEQVRIVNLDGEHIAKRIGELDFDFFSFGINSEADLKAQRVQFNPSVGLEVEIVFGDKREVFKMKNLLAKHSTYSILASTAVALSMGMDLKKIKEKVLDIKLDKGRMTLLEGINNSRIIDDSYNSSPVALKNALKTLSEFDESSRKVAVLGDMLELGNISEKEHREIGEYIEKLGNISLLITCGKEVKHIKNSDFTFENSQEAISVVKENIKNGDVILVKGSQGSRMEKIVKAIMQEPEKASELLVRQTGIWSKK